MVMTGILDRNDNENLSGVKTN